MRAAGGGRAANGRGRGAGVGRPGRAVAGGVRKARGRRRRGRARNPVPSGFPTAPAAGRSSSGGGGSQFAQLGRDSSARRPQPGRHDAQEEGELCRRGGQGGAQTEIGQAVRETCAACESGSQAEEGRGQASDKKVPAKGKRGAKGKATEVANQEAKEDVPAENGEAKSQESPASDAAGEKEAKSD